MTFNRKQRGLSLVEVLVVIVVFLVGVLAVANVFPGGLSILRTTRAGTMQTALSRAEMDRIKGMGDTLAEEIVPVSYIWTTGGVVILKDPTRQPNELMPPGSGVAPDGIVLDQNGNRVDHWAKMSGANLFSRVLGESKRIPSPRFIGDPTTGPYGGLVTLQFSPVYYSPGTSILQIYGQDLTRRYGNREFNNPNPYRGGRDFEYYFVYAEDTNDDPDPPEFYQQDQIWIRAPYLLRKYRVALSFDYNVGGETRQYDVVITANLDPANAGDPNGYFRYLGNYWIISVPRLLGQPDIEGKSLYNPQDFIGTIGGSVRVARVFNDVNDPATGLNGVFSSDPYEYNVLSSNLGFVLVNPAASNTFVRLANGALAPLVARMDYTVFDWRIIKDDFRVPQHGPYQQKLILNTIKVKGMKYADQLAFTGLGIQAPGAGGVADQDVILLDMETGGVILPNSYDVDRSLGLIHFVDLDGDPNNGLLAADIVFPTGDPNNPWDAQPTRIDDVRGRSVRLLYQGVGEWAVHVMKAAMQYRVTYAGVASDIGSAECYVGASNLNLGGEPQRIYFPWADVNKKVVVGEIIYFDRRTGEVHFLQDQEFQILPPRPGDPGPNLPALDIWDQKLRDQLAPLGYVKSDIVFDYSYGYSVRRVRGASVIVRVLWNPTVFFLREDPVANYAGLEKWMASYRRVQTESFFMGGGR